METYSHFLERLIEERQRLNWSQEEMAQKLGMTQSPYCRIEQGKRRLSQDSIVRLSALGVDVYYLFTGKKCKPEYKDVLSGFSYEELLSYLEAECALLKCLNVKKGNTYQKERYDLAERVQSALMPCQNHKTEIYTVRCLLHYTQKKMAEIMKMDVKKLRELENGTVKADSEILWNLNEKFGISYALFVKDINGLGCEVGYFAELLAGENWEKVFETLQKFRILII